MNERYRLRILHLSDLHARVALGSMDEKRRRLVRTQKPMRERVLGESFATALAEIGDEAAVDLVCFTGDLADWGLPEEYEQAGGVIDGVLARLHIDRSRLFVVPGNHDVNRKVAYDEWQQLRKLLVEREDVGARLGDWASGARVPSGVDPALLTNVIGRQSAFWTWVHDGMGRGELLPGATESNHPTLGYRATLEDGKWPFPIHVSGLNSGWLCGDDNDKGKVIVTREQVDWVCRDVNSKPLPGFRLALMHHSFGDLADMDAAEVKRALADTADLLLHGHQHDPQLEIRIDPDRTLNIAAAGSLYEGDKGDRFFNSFHVVDVWLDADGRHPQYDLTFYAWSANGHWHRSNAVYRNTHDGKLHWSAPGAEALVAQHHDRNLVYISYKKSDDQWRRRLRELLDADSRIEVWDDSKLGPGEDFRKTMKHKVSRARVMIVLASPEYLAAPLPLEVELTPAVAAADADELSLLWVPIRSFDYAASPLGPFMAPVDPGAPLEDMSAVQWRAALDALYRAVCQVLGLDPLPAPKRDLVTLLRDGKLI